MGTNDSAADRILGYFGRRHAALFDHLSGSLALSPDDVRAGLDELIARGWINEGPGATWQGEEPPTIYTLTDGGERELDRRDRWLGETGPVVLTREELFGELRDRFSLSDEQLLQQPTLRGRLFWYFPTVGAWSAIRS